jgi:hypothetical protein
MNETRHFAFCGTPGSLHKVVADVVWSSLRVQKDGSSGHIDFDAGHFNDLHPCTLPEFFDLAAGVARLTESFVKMDQKSIVCTGYPTARIRCISAYSADIVADLANQCIRSLDIPEPTILFVVDAADEVLRGRVNARRRDANMSVLDCMIRFYREISGANVVRLDTTEGPKDAADAAISQIRKALTA